MISDEKKRRSMGRKAREMAVRNFDWDIIAEKTERFYSEWYGEGHK